MTTPVQQETLYATASVATARSIQLAIRARLMLDVAKLWPALDPKRLAETFPGWKRAMSLLVGNYHRQSSVAASAFYRTVRTEAVQAPTPRSLIKLAPEPDIDWLDRAFGFSGPGLLTKDTAQPNTALSTTMGTATRIALEGGRATILETVKADPVAIGWYRVTDGDPCAFCALLASRPALKGRGSMYLSEESASFKAHNDCGCSAAPMFSRDQPLPDLSQEAAEVYRNKGAGDAMSAFRKAWAARHTSAAN